MSGQPAAVAQRAHFLVILPTLATPSPGSDRPARAAMRLTGTAAKHPSHSHIQAASSSRKHWLLRERDYRVHMPRPLIGCPTKPVHQSTDLNPGMPRCPINSTAGAQGSHTPGPLCALSPSPVSGLRTAVCQLAADRD